MAKIAVDGFCFGNNLQQGARSEDKNQAATPVPAGANTENGSHIDMQK